MNAEAARLYDLAARLRFEKQVFCRIFERIEDHCITGVLNIAIEKLDSVIIETESAARMADTQQYTEQVPAVLEQLIRSHEFVGRRGIFVLPSPKKEGA